MDRPSGTPRFAHPFRGTIVALLLGLPMVFFGLNAAIALLDQFVAGFIPGRWFSSNVFDWMTAFGTEGGTADYIVFMVNGMLAYGCYAMIARAFNGKGPDPSS